MDRGLEQFLAGMRRLEAALRENTAALRTLARQVHEARAPSLAAQVAASIAEAGDVVGAAGAVLEQLEGIRMARRPRRR